MIKDKWVKSFTMKYVCINRFLALLCGITTMNYLTNKFNNDFAISNFLYKSLSFSNYFKRF